MAAGTVALTHPAPGKIKQTGSMPHCKQLEQFRGDFFFFDTLSTGAETLLQKGGNKTVAEKKNSLRKVRVSRELCGCMSAETS